MRFVALALVLASLPIFIALLRTYPHRRSWAFGAIGALLLSNILPTGTFIYDWITWTAPVKGLEVSFFDTIALALLFTRSRAGSRLPFWGVLCFYGAMVFLSLFSAGVPMAAFFACWQFLRLLLLFAAVAGECHFLANRRALIAGLCIGGLVQAGFVAQQKLTGVVQAAGTFSHQNLLGMIVELAVLPVLASMLAGDRRKIVAAGAVAFLIVIAGGGSRGTVAFGTLGIALLLLLSFIRSRTPTKLKVVGAGLLVLAVAVPLTIGTLQERFGSVSLITVGDESREAMKRAARAISADHPFGIGANQYVNFAIQHGYSARAGVEWGSGTLGAPVHNAYLLARSETGWLGMFALILMLGVPAIRGTLFALTNRVGERGEAVLGSSVALIVNIVHNNYEYVVHFYSVSAMVVINIAIIAAIIRKPAPTPRHRSPAGSDRNYLPAHSNRNLANANRNSR